MTATNQPLPPDERAALWDAYREDLPRVAAELGVPVERLPRSQYIRRGRLGWSFKKQLGVGWSALRRACAEGGDAEPLGADDDVPQDVIPKGHRVLGVSSYVDPDGELRGQWVKTAAVAESREETLRRLLAELPAEVPHRVGRVEAPRAPLPDDVLAVYPMGDPHIGMLSWEPETGASFDLKLAEQIMRSAIDELAGEGPAARMALVVNLGDFYHSDNRQGRTTAGTQLDVDGRWPKVLEVGLRIMVYMIDAALSAHERVRVVNAIGNHDDHSAMFLSVALAAYYSGEPRVDIDTSPALRHYYRHGRVLLGITHGHTAKGDKLPQIMAAERAEEWGATEHRAWLCGHVHHKTQTEHLGCVVETFRTLAPRDAWHAGQGYRSGRDMNRIAYHREYGEIARSTVSASYLASRYGAAA